MTKASLSWLLASLAYEQYLRWRWYGTWPLVNIIINSVSYRALFDTGASYTVISKDILSSIGNPTLLPTKVRCQGVTGQQMHFIGKTPIKLTIGSRMFMQVVQVSENYGYNCIIGPDFMRKLGPVQVDFTAGYISFSLLPGVRNPQHAAPIRLPLQIQLKFLHNLVFLSVAVLLTHPNLCLTNLRRCICNGRSIFSKTSGSRPSFVSCFWIWSRYHVLA